ANDIELGWVWIVAAAIMVVCAARGKHRPSFTTVGFLTAMAPPTLWALLFGGAVILGVSPTAIVSVVMYGAFACIIFFVSGWPNPRGSDATGGADGSANPAPAVPGGCRSDRVGYMDGREELPEGAAGAAARREPSRPGGPVRERDRTYR